MSGIAHFQLRDIVRSKPPVDGSPIEWGGSGPMFLVARDRTSDACTHRIEFVFFDTNTFSYQSPLRTYAASASDEAVQLEGRYEYRRRMLSRKLPAWVRASFGVRGSGSHLSLTHFVDPRLDIGLTNTTGGAAFVLAATVGAGRRVSADVNFANGILVGWLQPQTRDNWSAGGWTTDLTIAGQVRMTQLFALTGGYFNRGDTLLSGHRGLSTNQQQFSIGVTYAK